MITIQIDTREQRPLEITAYPTERIGLPVGDYGIRNFSDWNNPRFIVERKSVDDLVGSVTSGRARFLKEIEKLRQFEFRALLIEGTRLDVELGHFKSCTAPASVLATLDAISVRANVHCFWCSDPEGAARQLESLVRQFIRGIEKQARLILAPKAA